MIVLGQGDAPIRLDLIVRAGEPVNRLLPAYDAAGALVSFAGGAWTLAAEILAPDRLSVAQALTLNGLAEGLELRATAAETLAWPASLPTFSPFRIVATHASGDPIFRTNGWIAYYR